MSELSRLLEISRKRREDTNILASVAQKMSNGFSMPSFTPQGISGAAATALPWTIGLTGANMLMKAAFGPNFDEQLISLYNNRQGVIDPMYKANPTGVVPRARTLAGINQEYSPNGVPDTGTKPAPSNPQPYQVFQAHNKPWVYVDSTSPLRGQLGGDRSRGIGISASQYGREKNAYNWVQQAKAEEERGGK